MLVDTLRMWTESNSIVLIERKERSSHGSTCKKKEKSFQSAGVGEIPTCIL